MLHHSPCNNVPCILCNENEEIYLTVSSVHKHGMGKAEAKSFIHNTTTKCIIRNFYLIGTSGLRVYTSGSVYVGHEAVAQVVYINCSHRYVSHRPQTGLSNNWRVC